MAAAQASLTLKDLALEAYRAAAPGKLLLASELEEAARERLNERLLTLLAGGGTLL